MFACYLDYCKEFLDLDQYPKLPEQDRAVIADFFSGELLQNGICVVDRLSYQAADWFSLASSMETYISQWRLSVQFEYDARPRYP